MPISSAWPQKANAAQATTPTAVATFTGHGGKYEVTYDWAIVN